MHHYPKLFNSSICLLVNNSEFWEDILIKSCASGVEGIGDEK
jgi:hypothetical protein